MSAAGTGSEQSSGVSEPHASRPPAVTYHVLSLSVTIQQTRLNMSHLMCMMSAHTTASLVGFLCLLVWQ